MAYGNLYCGYCHKWLDDRSPAERGEVVCNCFNPDLTKDPNCLNPFHNHHDPESPIVLGNKRIREAEERADAGCKGEDGLENNEFSFDTIDELDEILEETNRQVDSECLAQGHIWVRVGTVIKTIDRWQVVPGSPWPPHEDAIDWGPEMCLRCGEPAPEEEPQYGQVGSEWIPPPPVEKCLVHSGSITPDGLICDRCGHNMYEIQPAPEPKKPEPKHACPGCNLRDLTMNEAKRYLNIAVGWMPDNDMRREIMQWLRLTGRIRAMKED